MPDTTQSEEFMRTTVNGTDFVVMKHLKEENDKYKEYRFITDFQGEEHTMKVQLQTEVMSDLEENFGINAEEELLQVMKAEIHAELNQLTAEA